jgi:cell division protein FtsX
MEEEIKNDEVQEEVQVSEKPMDKMTVKELREIAKDVPGVTGVHAMKKDELLAVIEEAKEIETAKHEEVSEKPLEKMTAKELREIAKDILGISGVHAMKKDELLAVIKEDRGIKDKKPVKKVEKKADKVTLSVKDLKKKIALLREEKELARKAKDRERLNVLRRRMNRMKKLTRRVAHA